MPREVKTADKALSVFLLKEESKGRRLSSRREEKNAFLRLSGKELVFFDYDRAVSGGGIS